MNRIAGWYVGYGVVVGGALLLLLLVGTQAAHSGAERALAPLLGVVVPIPTMLTGAALRRPWRGAWVPSLVLPLLMAAGVARLWGRPQPPPAAGLLASFVFNAAVAQLYFLPGTTVLALAVVARLLRGRRDQARRGDTP